MAVRSDTGGDEEPEAYFWIDNCETAYFSQNMKGHGDVGMNIAEHPKSHVAGLESLEDFHESMSQASQVDEVSHSSELVWWLGNQAGTDDIDELRQVAADAQHPHDYGQGFEHFNRYLSGEPVSRDVVTAAWEDPVETVLEERMNGYSPGVIGGKLRQNGEGIEVDEFCGGEEKSDRIRQERGVDVAEEPSFAFGNSSGDRSMMLPAEEAFGRDRARKFSTLYTPDDPEFWTRGLLGVGAYELAAGGQVGDAVFEMEDYLETGAELYGEVVLDTVETGGREPGQYTEDLIEAYEAVMEGERW
jgi:hypothetical protein